MNLGVQYYRAPFPEDKYWEDDFKRIKDCGLNTVQLWILWSWVESKPGTFDFGDYDRLVDLAAKNDLKLVLSTIGEIHPYWIFREVGGGEMVDHMGNKVVSSNRVECHFGLTPGGCTDHPEVWKRMADFLAACANQYKDADHVVGWDAWNEKRWNVHSDGFVCFCKYTLEAYRNWLDAKYGGLDGLNAAWKRRYGAWDEVLPGKMHMRPYTDMMAFNHFITWRADQLGINRCRIIKEIVGDVPVTVHGGMPTPLFTGGVNQFNHAINRGNDWNLADALDGIGCSSFPVWQKYDDIDFAARIEYIRSAARGKQMWLSELQGGRSCNFYHVGPDFGPAQQQHWVYNGIACGAKTILFWCWRDEVFGRESSGFGIYGDDPNSQDRLEAMKITGDFITTHEKLIADYVPDSSPVGVMFSPQSYYVDFAQTGSANMAADSLSGFCRALLRNQTNYVVIEEEHLEELENIKILFMPHVLVTEPHVEAKLAEWIRNGGTLVTEAECGAFDAKGFYRYAPDRFTAKLAGIEEIGRRHPTDPSIDVNIDGTLARLCSHDYLSPWQSGGKVLAKGRDGDLITEVQVGKGRMILCGAFVGRHYFEENTLDFERYIHSLVKKAEARPPIRVLHPAHSTGPTVHVRGGVAGDKRVVFVMLPEGTEGAELLFEKGFFHDDTVEDILSGEACKLKEHEEGMSCNIRPKHWGIAVLVGKK
ncbi:MAG: beta-galactosidase [Candidatus Sumerlaeia bacterium]